MHRSSKPVRCIGVPRDNLREQLKRCLLLHESCERKSPDKARIGEETQTVGR